MEETNSAADFQKLRELIREIDFCMLTTVDEHDDLHSRPMSLNGEVDEAGNLWFFTSANSHKVFELSRTPKCNASFANPDDNRYVSISGRAELVRDKAKIEELWKPELKAWFPKGTDEPDLALLRLGIDKVNTGTARAARWPRSSALCPRLLKVKAPTGARTRNSICGERATWQAIVGIVEQGKGKG